MAVLKQEDIMQISMHYHLLFMSQASYCNGLVVKSTLLLGPLFGPISEYHDFLSFSSIYLHNGNQFTTMAATFNQPTALKQMLLWHVINVSCLIVQSILLFCWLMLKFVKLLFLCNAVLQGYYI